MVVLKGICITANAETHKRSVLSNAFPIRQRMLYGTKG
jgi:hypothetical protein